MSSFHAGDGNFLSMFLDILWHETKPIVSFPAASYQDGIFSQPQSMSSAASKQSQLVSADSWVDPLQHSKKTSEVGGYLRYLVQ